LTGVKIRRKKSRNGMAFLRFSRVLGTDRFYVLQTTNVHDVTQRRF